MNRLKKWIRGREFSRFTALSANQSKTDGAKVEIARQTSVIFATSGTDACPGLRQGSRQRSACAGNNGDRMGATDKVAVAVI
jgi:hypothetical protein